MTKLEEMQDATARNAVGAALEAARESYREIREARDELNEMESRGVYAEGYVEEQRSDRAEAVRASVQDRLADARKKAGAAGDSIEGKLEKLAAVEPEELAAAHRAISPFLGDLRGEPERLLGAYERSFDVPADRRAIEELAERALRVLPEPSRGLFAPRWEELQKRLEDRLPAEQRPLRAALNELARAVGYLAAVEQVTTDAVNGLVEPRAGRNLTAFSQAHAYEQEVSGESAVRALPHAAVLDREAG